MLPQQPRLSPLPAFVVASFALTWSCREPGLTNLGLRESPTHSPSSNPAKGFTHPYPTPLSWLSMICWAGRTAQNHRPAAVQPDAWHKL